MLRVRDGSREAFYELYQLFQKPLANFFYRLCWNPSRVDDLVQEVFLRIWRTAPNYEPRAKVSTWIFQIAHNLWINQSLKRTEQPIEDTVPTVLSAPDDPMRREELRNSVRRAVESLPEPEREVLILAEYNGFRYQEIADILGIPVGTVKSRMFSATARLRKTLRPQVEE